jgi:hypothetical protein
MRDVEYKFFTVHLLAIIFCDTDFVHDIPFE